MQKIGVQLYQFSSGNDGKVLGNGVVVQSTQESMARELNAALDLVLTQGEAYRSRVAAVADILQASSASGGARAGMQALSEHIESLADRS